MPTNEQWSADIPHAQTAGNAVVPSTVSDEQLLQSLVAASETTAPDHELSTAGHPVFEPTMWEPDSPDSNLAGTSPLAEQETVADGQHEAADLHACRFAKCARIFDNPKSLRSASFLFLAEFRLISSGITRKDAKMAEFPNMSARHVRRGIGIQKTAEDARISMLMLESNAQHAQRCTRDETTWYAISRTNIQAIQFPQLLRALHPSQLSQSSHLHSWPVILNPSLHNTCTSVRTPFISTMLWKVCHDLLPPHGQARFPWSEVARMPHLSWMSIQSSRLSKQRHLSQSRTLSVVSLIHNCCMARNGLALFSTMSSIDALSSLRLPSHLFFIPS